MQSTLPCREIARRDVQHSFCSSEVDTETGFNTSFPAGVMQYKRFSIVKLGFEPVLVKSQIFQNPGANRGSTEHCFLDQVPRQEWGRRAFSHRDSQGHAGGPNSVTPKTQAEINTENNTMFKTMIQATVPTMRHSNWSALLIIVVIAALAANIVANRAADAGEAFGGGVADVPDTTIVEQLSFHVRETGNPSDDLATGEIKLLAKEDGRISFLSLLQADCMRFLDDQTAIIAATVRNDSDPEFIGTTAILTVRDNGEGAGAPSDEFTGIFYALDNPDVDQWTCQAGVDFLDANPGALEELLTPFEPGNIHVRSSALASAVPVPEPTGATLGLFAAVLLACMYRRRHKRACETADANLICKPMKSTSDCPSQTTLQVAGCSVLCWIVSVSLWATQASAESILVADFHGGNDDGWTRVDSNTGQPWGPGIFDASSGAYQLMTTDVVPEHAPGRGFLASFWDKSSDPSYSNGFVRAKVRVDTFKGVGALLFRYSGDLNSGLDGYAFVGLAGDGFYFNRIENTNLARVLKLPGEFMGVGEDWWMDVGGVEDQISMKVWRDGELEPELPQLTLTDSTFASGVFGVDANMEFNSPVEGIVDTTFDDIYFTPAVQHIVGDFDGDGALLANDIDLLVGAVGGSEELFDLDNDGSVDQEDRRIWVEDIFGTHFGDADLNRKVEFADFLLLSNNFSSPGGWEDGNFDGIANVGVCRLSAPI